MSAKDVSIFDAPSNLTRKHRAASPQIRSAAWRNPTNQGTICVRQVVALPRNTWREERGAGYSGNQQRALLPHGLRHGHTASKIERLPPTAVASNTLGMGLLLLATQVHLCTLEGASGTCGKASSVDPCEQHGVGCVAIVYVFARGTFALCWDVHSLATSPTAPLTPDVNLGTVHACSSIKGTPLATRTEAAT